METLRVAHAQGEHVGSYRPRRCPDCWPTVAAPKTGNDVDGQHQDTDHASDGRGGADGQRLPGVSTEFDVMERVAQAVIDAREAYEDAPPGSSAETAANHACEANEHQFFDLTGLDAVRRLRELEALATAAVDWMVASKLAAKVRAQNPRGPGLSPIDLAEIERLDRIIMRSRAEMERLLKWRVHREIARCHGARP